MLYFILILISASKIKAVTVDIDGSIDLGPQWKYEYKIQPIADPKDSKETKNNHTTDDTMSTNRKHNIATDIAVAAGSKLYNIIKNFQLEDVKSEEDIVIAEPKAHLENLTTKVNKKLKKSHIRLKHTTRRHHKETVTEKSDLSDIVTKKSRKSTTKKSKASSDDDIKTTKEKLKKTTKNVKSDESEKSEKSETSESEKEEKATSKKLKTKTKATTIKEVTLIVPTNNGNMFVKPVRVKDDTALTDHIQHIYKQSLKVFEDLKNKVDNYKLKKEIKFIARSYDEKFKEFVKKTKYHPIKSRLGKKKVILNAAETSNKILDRLIGYLKSKVETQGLRSNVPNVFEKELLKKIDLENQRMCKKFGICRSGKGIRHFLIEAFTIILNLDDAKVKQVSDAMTEVLKNRDLSIVMDKETEKQFSKGIREFESYGVDILRPVYFIMRNILVNINEPLKVTNKDRTVNKTIAFIEFIDVFEEKMPPTEENKLSRDDMLNTLRAWSRNERDDITDLIETFVDHMMKLVEHLDLQTAKQLERNVKIMIF